MKLLKIILGSFLIAVLLITALALPVWYIYSQGNQFVVDAEKSAQNRSYEMAITLNTMSAESLYYDNLIALSSTLATVVNQSSERNDPFKIQEIFVVDKTGNLIAHSDIAKMAAESFTKYDSSQYHFGEVRFKSDPISIEVTERVKPEYGSLVKNLKLEPVFDYLLNKMLPNLAASRYHVAGSIYQPDDSVSSGSIHLLIQNQNAAFVLGHYISMVLKVLSIAILGAIGLWVVFTILLAVLVFSPKQSAVLNTQTNYVEVEAPVAFETIPENQNLNVANLEEYRDRKKVVNQTQELADSDNVEHGQIYDAIPINRLS